MKWFCFFFLFWLSASCQSTQKQQLSSTLKKTPIVFLDSTKAAAAIIDDDMEHFFDQVTITEMSIQLKKNFPGDTPRAEIAQTYRSFLQTDVESFTAEERDFVNKVFEQVKALSDAINPAIFSDEIELIKTKARHYGPSVYYTRENRIIIPQNELDQRNESGFRQVMLHELFHVFSRLNPDVKTELYKLIGFEKVNASMAELKMNDALRRRILLNPDGIDFSYAITLKDKNGKTFQAIPIIAANAFNFKPEQPAFFSYLSFNLYPIKKLDSGQYEVITQADGNSSIALNNQADFFGQIRDNTQYIIHPDEIMADNFALLALSKTEDPKHSLKRLSTEGQQLIAEIEAILKK